MTRYTLLSILFFIIISDLQAQQEDRFSYGLYLTPKTAQVYFEDHTLGAFDVALGLNAQFTINYRWNEKFAVVTGLKFISDRFSTIDYTARVGCDFNRTGVDWYNSWYDNEFAIQYLGVPLEGRYYFKRQANRLYVKLGYEYFFKIGESRDASLFLCGTSEQSLPNDIGDQAKNYGTKINFGLGWEVVTSGKSVITIEPEAAYSTIYVYEEAGIFVNSTNNIKLLDLGLRLGVTF